MMRPRPHPHQKTPLRSLHRHPTLHTPLRNHLKPLHRSRKPLLLTRIHPHPHSPRQLRQMMRQRSHHHNHTIRTQHPPQLRAMTRRENYQRNLNAPIPNRKTLPRISHHRHQPRMRLSRPTRRIHRQIHTHPKTQRRLRQHPCRVITSPTTTIQNPTQLRPTSRQHPLFEHSGHHTIQNRAIQPRRLHLKPRRHHRGIISNKTMPTPATQ